MNKENIVDSRIRYVSIITAKVIATCTAAMQEIPHWGSLVSCLCQWHVLVGQRNGEIILPLRKSEKIVPQEIDFSLVSSQALTKKHWIKQVGLLLDICLQIYERVPDVNLLANTLTFTQTWQVTKDLDGYVSSFFSCVHSAVDITHFLPNISSAGLIRI